MIYSGYPISRLFIFAIMIFVSNIPMFAQKQKDNDIYDMQSAQEYCDMRALMRPEGIWEFPEDATKVMIMAAPNLSRSYDIILISSPDCRLRPGDRIGKIEETIDPDKYLLSLYCDHRKGILTDMRSCSAELDKDEGTLRITPRGVKLSVRTIRLLPSFWSLFGISFDNPQSKLPVGLIRIYPSNTSPSNRHPRYF